MLTKSGNGVVETLDNASLRSNALNQVARANISGPQGASVIDYAYDHDGIRVGKTVNGADITSYVYGKDILSRTTGGAPDYYLYDGFGSVRGLSDTSGSVTGSYAYDAYGTFLDSNGTSANPYRYRGEQYDPELEAYYLRARYYQPEIGRFTAADSFEGSRNNPATQHRYLYGNNNPVSYIDPNGEMSLMEMGAVGGARNAVAYCCERVCLVVLSECSV